MEEYIEESDFNIMQKALTGMSVIGFVKDFRLKKAAQLLVQDTLNVTEFPF